MARDPSHDASLLRDPRCINFILPFDPSAPTAFELGTFVQMVTHALECKFSNCYLTGGSLNCHSIKKAVRHCHHRNRMHRGCLCPLCRSFGKLYARHVYDCPQPIGQCPFAICGTIKRRVGRHLQREAAQSRAAPDSTTANGPLVENVPAQQPNNDFSEEIQQNLNVDVAMTERTSQSPTSTSE